ncbi:MAG: translocation/assembly module TamB domain-containing protein, partial [Burkholderiaceae bacterium]|nr:translocation/assembly module TamB domain-containing protein [Burkholderiaceae bacterium]
QTTSPAGSAPAQQLRAGVQTRLSGGLTSAGQWQAQINALRLQVQNTVGTANAANGVTPRAAAPWVLELTDTVTVTANTNGTAATTASTANAANAIKASGTSAPLKAQASAGSARVTGPLPGAVTLRWQPVQLALGTAPAALPQLQTQGTLQGLPMAWVDALGLNNRKDAVDAAAAPSTASNPAQPLLQSMGLATSLVFDGQWNVDTTAPNALKASASLRRASGDLRILAGDATAVTAVQSSGQGAGAGTATAVATEASQAAAAPGAGLPAGVRQAELSVQAQGDILSARLLWASDRAGEVDARVSTRLTFNTASPAPSAPTAPVGRGAAAAAPATPPTSAPSAITLAPNAPLEGTVRARLPDVGVWGMLAPPGWRVRGTLDANATLSGTLDAPRWTGTLGADNMAVRSVIDGIDLQGGRLRATLRGNHIDITELRLQGGRGSSARITGYSGNLTAAAQDGGTLTGSGSINWTDRADGASGLSGIRMALQAEAKGLQVLTRADRQISVSGPMQASLEQGQIRLRGKLTVDRATIILPDETAPSLGSDVVVRSR